MYEICNELIDLGFKIDCNPINKTITLSRSPGWRIETELEGLGYKLLIIYKPIEI